MLPAVCPIADEAFYQNSGSVEDGGCLFFLPYKCAQLIRLCREECPQQSFAALAVLGLMCQRADILLVPFFSLKAEAAEMDGFQADTEEDEEDDDCMIVDIQPGKGGEIN